MTPARAPPTASRGPSRQRRASVHPGAIRPAAPGDRAAIWAILEPVLRAGETYALNRDLTREAALAYWLGADRIPFVAAAAGEIDPVVGRDAEIRQIIDILLRAFPEHGILAEESGAQGKADSEHTWIIDPLDGTTNFIHGFPQYAVSIALRHREQLVHGVIYDPTRNELFTATKGVGAFLNDKLDLAQAEAVADLINAQSAEAARLASRDAKAGAIASKTAAELYQLNLLARNIQDESSNTTRFLVLSRDDVAPSGCDKTSLILSTRNVPGAIHDLLSPLAKNGVSMTRLESRPAKTGLWEYVFYIDIEGHARDVKVAQALAQIERKASFLKNLGSYPAVSTAASR